MPKLITKIEARVLDNFTGSVYIFNNLSGQVQFEDYVNMNGFVAYLQNFTKVGFVQTLTKPSFFGLKNQYNLPTISLQISY
jgi:hypothetical protein